MGRDGAGGNVVELRGEGGFFKGEESNFYTLTLNCTKFGPLL